MENHSFDNVLGYWCNSNPSRCPDGGMPATVTLSNGTTVTPTVAPDTVPDLLHTVAAQLAAMDGGKMDGWQNIPGGGCSAATHYQCISGYMPSQIPNLTTLAQNFAISDHTFSMADSPSWGGHLYAALASLDRFTGDNPVTPKGGTAGPGWGCDSKKVTPWVSATGQLQKIPSCIPDPSLGLPNGGAYAPTPAQYAPTIFDRLAAAGLSWQIYGAAAAKVGGYDWSICPSIAECLYTSQKANLVDQGQFLTAAQAGTLPSFSIVTGGGLNAVAASCHNKFSMTACDNRIGQLVSAVQKGPDWSSTAVFITFDDCGCFYDQVPPPRAPDGTQEGPRTPLIIVSPYARPGYTDTTPATFASILAYTEQNFGLSPLGVNDAQAYPFTNAFNYSQTPLTGAPIQMIKLPESARDIKITKADLLDPS